MITGNTVFTRKPRITLLDVVLILMLLTAVIYLIYRIRVSVHYHWNWQVIPQYLFRYDSGSWVPNVLIQGLLTTIRLSIWGTLIATVLGFIMGLCRVNRRLFFRLIGRTYVELIRNLPPLVLIFIFYFFVSSQIMPLLGVEEFIRSRSPVTQQVLGILFEKPSQFTAFLSAIITLAVFEGAYITEIVRAGIQSIDPGQREAAYALGFTRWQQMRHVTLPQAIQRIIPPMAGQFISTIKDSAIVSVISIQDLTFQGMELMAATYLTFEIWITITLLYLVLTLSLSLVFRRLELHLRRSWT